MEREQVIEALRSLSLVALDFETANESRHSVCAIGLAVVQDGQITSTHKHLVRPPEMRFADINQSLHHIRPEDVESAPDFDEVWAVVETMIWDKVVVMHNAEFDMNVLKQSLEYHFMVPPLMRSLCTLKLSQVAYPNHDEFRLADMARFLGINFRHHDCSEDARVAALIAIDALPKVSLKKLALDKENLTSSLNKRPSSSKAPGWGAFKEKAMSPDLLKQDLTHADPENPFYGKRLVFTGDLASMVRSEAAAKVQALGADVNTAISRKTEIVIKGAGAGPSKMRKIDELIATGVSIEILDESEFLQRLAST